jgi:hypothetical protein
MKVLEDSKTREVRSCVEERSYPQVLDHVQNIRAKALDAMHYSS